MSKRVFFMTETGHMKVAPAFPEFGFAKYKFDETHLIFSIMDKATGDFHTYEQVQPYLSHDYEKLFYKPQDVGNGIFLAGKNKVSEFHKFGTRKIYPVSMITHPEDAWGDPVEPLVSSNWLQFFPSAILQVYIVNDVSFNGTPFKMYAEGFPAGWQFDIIKLTDAHYDADNATAANSVFGLSLQDGEISPNLPNPDCLGTFVMHFNNPDTSEKLYWVFSFDLLTRRPAVVQTGTAGLAANNYKGIVPLHSWVDIRHPRHYVDPAIKPNITGWF